MKPTTNEDSHLEKLRDQHFPDAADRQWPPPNRGPGWFKAPRALPVLLQILTDKGVISRGNPGLAYIELLSRVREQGVVLLEHPEDHARIVGYRRRGRTWREAMQQLSELGLIETKASHDREFGYALLLNPFIAVRRLHREGKVSEPLWNLFFEKWTRARAGVPDEEPEVVAPEAKKAGARAADSPEDRSRVEPQARPRRRPTARTKKKKS